MEDSTITVFALYATPTKSKNVHMAQYQVDAGFAAEYYLDWANFKMKQLFPQATKIEVMRIDLKGKCIYKSPGD